MKELVNYRRAQMFNIQDLMSILISHNGFFNLFELNFSLEEIFNIQYKMI